MRLTVLGSSGTYPGPGGAASSYLLEGSQRVVLDLGSGALANLQMHAPLDGLDAVVLTHAHADHWTDLLMLRVAMRYVLGIGGLPVYGTAETLEMAESIAGDRLSPTLAWQTITEADVVSVGDWRLSFSQTDHPVETLAVRVDGDGRSFGYSADTGPGWSLASLGPGLDLAVCEASYTSDAHTHGVHLSAGQAGADARAAGIPRLVLTHHVYADPGAEGASGTDRAAIEVEYRRRAESAFGGPVEVAAPHERYDV